jgi:hypothetical protein
VPHIQSGLVSYVALLRAMTNGESADTTGVRAWFEDLRHEAPTSISQHAAPLAAAYLARADVENARFVAADLRVGAASIGNPPLHRACHLQITRHESEPQRRVRTRARPR